METVVSLMDFAYNKEKGYKWIDELRSKSPAYYKKISLPSVSFSNTSYNYEKQYIIPSIHKFVSRNNILEGHVSQIKFFSDNNIRPSDFDRTLKDYSKDNNDAIIILEPKYTVQKQS